MKKYLILLLITVLFSSCYKETYYESNNLPLRQLVNGKDTNTYSKGWFFIAAGRYSSGTETNEYIKMYALVDGTYKYLEYDIKKVRISLNNSVKTPYIKIYGSYSASCTSCYKHTDEWKTSNKWGLDKVVLYTPEEYLPEYLIPIKLE